MDFITIDFETATADRDSPCEIGLTFVKDRQIIETKSWLIKPMYHVFDYFNILIHGIRPEDVADKPEFNIVWKEIRPLVENQFLIAHNAGFDIRISMTENGDPLENAIAERVNGIIKEEYLNNYQTENLQEATRQLKKAINLYNNDRPHMSISNLTPTQLHNNQKLNHQRLWKNYYKKLNNFESKNEIDPVNLLQDLTINM